MSVPLDIHSHTLTYLQKAWSASFKHCPAQFSPFLTHLGGANLGKFWTQVSARLLL